MPGLIPITAHTEALSARTIGPVVTEGQKYERALATVLVQTHDFSSSSPRRDLSPLGAQAAAKAGDAEVDRSPMNRKMGSCWFHQNEENKGKKKKTKHPQQTCWP